jgi:hypothetical protein
MFKNIFVIGIDRKKLVFAKIKSAGMGKIVKSSMVDYNFVDIRDVLVSAKKKLGFKRVRILFADDLSYVLEMKIPDKLKGNDEKKYIYEKILEEIPESLNDSEWDFKELTKVPHDDRDKGEKEGDELKRIIVFAPVKNLYKRISDILISEGVVIEAVESETIATKRSSNPLIGIAKKTDLEGKDEEVLNITSHGKKTVKETQSESEKGSKRPKWKIVSIVFMVLVATLTLIYLSLSYFFQDGDKENVQSDTVIEEEQTLNTSNHSILILNGSGVTDAAAEVEEILSFEGFNNFETGSMEVSDLDQTQVRMKESVSDETFETIERALNSEYNIVLSKERLDEESEYDIEITLGTPLNE